MAPISRLEISRTDLQELDTPASASIADVKQLSSYNWLEAPQDTPTIAVPGSPALWSAPAGLRQVKKDSGLIYIAQNAARHPESPLEPLFRALYVTHPSFDIRSVDVVTDRNNIRKLLSFVDPSTARNGLEEFTINIEVTQNTAIFSRNEAKTQEYIGPHEFRGFGHEFEKAYTVNQIHGSTGHHRIISYRLGDLNFIVRYETDGYIDINTKTQSSNAKTPTQDSLSSLLGGMSLSSADSYPSPGSKLNIKKEGKGIPLETTLEIKTRVSHKPLEFEEIAPQLWVSQTPKLVRAYHQKGIFQAPVVEDVAATVKRWETRHQNDLKRLAGLIKRIINLVKECGGNAVLKYSVVGDKLVVSKVERKEMLPKDLYSKWEVEDSLHEETKSEKGSFQKSNIPQTEQTATPTASAAADNSKTTMKIGGINYSVDVSKMPYLEYYIGLQEATQPQGTELIHGPIKLFDVALKGIESGYRQCFRSLPIELSQYRTLLQTYEFLEVDILNNLSIDQVIANLKVGRADYDPEERRGIPGNKSLARDTAFQLMYLILNPQHMDEMKDKMKLFNAVVFVVSHPGTFKHRTKRIIRLAYVDQFGVTLKQGTILQKWEKGGAIDDEPDVTTEAEPAYSSDSDDD